MSNALLILAVPAFAFVLVFGTYAYNGSKLVNAQRRTIRFSLGALFFVMTVAANSQRLPVILFRSLHSAPTSAHVNSQGTPSMKPSKSTILTALVCIAFGFVLANVVSTPPASAQVGAPGGPARFQISSFPSTDGKNHGAYAIDTMTGVVWLIVPNQQPKRVNQNLP